MIKKGIILAGGKGTRLLPFTKICNKHLALVYDKPMVYYPIQTLLRMGINEIMVVTGCEHMGQVINVLKSGKDFGCNFQYAVQEEAGGIAQALGLCEKFADKNNIAVILGDNIFEDSFEVSDFEEGAQVFLKEVPDPQRFGVPVFDDKYIKQIEEKPIRPKSNYAVTGLYLYDNRVFDIIRTLKPSQRGELEITDVNNYYISNRGLHWTSVPGFWSDAGTPSSLLRSANYIKENYAYFN